MEARASYNQLSTASIRPTSVLLKAADDDAHRSLCNQQDANTDNNYLGSPVVQRISTGEEKKRPPPAVLDKVTRLMVEAGDTTVTSSGTDVVRRNRAAAGQNRARLVQSLYISSSEPSVSFQSALSRFQQLASCQSADDGLSSAAKSFSDSESVGKFGCSAAELLSDSHVKNRKASADVSSESVSRASISSIQSEQTPISTGKSVDCKTIQTDESFLLLYRSKRKLHARRSEAVSSKEKRLGHQSRRPEAALEPGGFSSPITDDRPSFSTPLGGYSPNSKDGPRRTVRPEAVLRTAGSLLTSADRLSLPKEYSSPEAKNTCSHSVRPEAVLRNVVSSPVFIKERLNFGWEASPGGVPPLKPVRGQCWDLTSLSSPLQPPSSMSPQGVARPPVVTSAPYKRSLSRSSQCLLSSSLSVQSLCSPPALPWDHQRSRDLAHQDWEAKFFSDCVYEGQSTLV